MPYTPYHFGPSGLVGLAFRRWIDAPVFALANVAIDCEVVLDWIFEPGWPVHQTAHFHTLIGGALFGAVYGLAMYRFRPLRAFCEKSMEWFGLPYRAILSKMILAGILGVWFHIAVDCIHHEDVQIFWPFRMDNPVWALAVGPYLKYIHDLRNWVVAGCIISWAALAVYYGSLIDIFHFRRQRIENARKARLQAASPTAINNN
jgi:hypothetical protein